MGVFINLVEIGRKYAICVIGLEGMDAPDLCKAIWHIGLQRGWLRLSTIVQNIWLNCILPVVWRWFTIPSVHTSQATETMDQSHLPSCSLPSCLLSFMYFLPSFHLVFPSVLLMAKKNRCKTSLFSWSLESNKRGNTSTHSGLESGSSAAYSI